MPWRRESLDRHGGDVAGMDRRFLAVARRKKHRAFFTVEKNQDVGREETGPQHRPRKPRLAQPPFAVDMRYVRGSLQMILKGLVGREFNYMRHSRPPGCFERVRLEFLDLRKVGDHER